MQILIWGDEMKPKISICIFICIILLLIAILFAYNWNAGSENLETTETELLVASTEDAVVTSADIYYTYIVREQDGWVVVCLPESEEVYMETGETITAHNERTAAIPPRFDPLWIGTDYVNRQDLYDRVDLRVELMVKDGLLDEIRAVLGSGIPEKCTAMQAIGYKEFIDAMAGRASLDEAIRQVQQSSRRYAKRQQTWFKRNEKIHWLLRRKGQPSEEIFSAACQIASNFDK